MMDKNGQYTVKACYGQLEGECSNIIPEGLVWNSYIPPKVSVFLREVWWGKVQTLNQLKKEDFSSQVDAHYATKKKRVSNTF